MSSVCRKGLEFRHGCLLPLPLLHHGLKGRDGPLRDDIVGNAVIRKDPSSRECMGLSHKTGKHRDLNLVAGLTDGPGRPLHVRHELGRKNDQYGPHIGINGDPFEGTSIPIRRGIPQYIHRIDHAGSGR